MQVLGLDLSTQSLTAVLIPLSHASTSTREEVIYDRDLPQYRTTAGVNSDRDRVWSDPRMWLDALDLALGRLVERGARLEDVGAVCGAAQQHGTVYVTEEFDEVLSSAAPPSVSLSVLFRSSFSTLQSPIWMDSSTSLECSEILSALPSPSDILSITGSSLYERFSAPQIRKLWKSTPDIYAKTAHILLVSSFMSAILSGKQPPFYIDESDASGTGLMDIQSKAWSELLLSATAPGLLSKLPTIRTSGTSLGPISPYFQRKYRLPADCKAVIWSGDNPASALSLGLTVPGRIGVSLGSSDTLFVAMKRIPEGISGERTVFLSPTGEFLPIIVVKNGAAARLHARDRFPGYTWEEFDKAASEPTPGVLLFFSLPEITPKLPSPVYLESGLRPNSRPDCLCRLLLESQVINIRIAADSFCKEITEIAITGGAADCGSLRQILADVFQVSVYKADQTDHAAIGAGILAAHSLAPEADWNQARARVVQTHGAVTTPQAEMRPYYDRKTLEFRGLLANYTQ